MRAIINKLKGNHEIEFDPEMAPMCEHCIQSKSMTAQMGQGSECRALSPLNLVHIDLIIDSSHATEHTCMLVLVDDHSKYMGRRLKAIQSDQGTKWRSNEAIEWTYDKGIKWQMTVGYNSQQNRHVERMNWSLGEKMQVLLMQRRLSKRFWLYAIQAVAFKINLILSVDREFLYQAMFGKPPEKLMCLICIFGCLAWVNIPKVK
ncbi:hypothetical protein NDA11_005764 [Ustilago hordei]|nr:hypothetical protein NDA10_001882 [Ustilago hordei]KAJ1573307.1 hypothetical protein NDA15_004000 [Ustilago hordei]KAJ1574733.1 hypothetical protein NDA12_002613 [Ustilago hordei]KAJ1576739.1 hypothetical protein NDA11_005764 [Ustilago hordei]KAJ1596360.1 hypothetical protein NDA14_005636 [Ustilago hordei]